MIAENMGHSHTEDNGLLSKMNLHPSLLGKSIKWQVKLWLRTNVYDEDDEK